MSWRLHLGNQPLRRLHILPGNPSQIAVSDTRHRFRFYDLDSGGHYGDLEIDLDLLDNDVQEERRDGQAALKAPNGAFLPFVAFNNSQLYTSLDGNLRLIHDLNAGLSLEIEDQIIPLDTGKNTIVRMADLERELGTALAITDDNLLHIYQQQTRVNSFALDDTTLLRVFLTQHGSRVVLVQPELIKIMDTSGKTLYSQEIHFSIGLVALSPDGNWLAISDSDNQVIRLYNDELMPVRQQHAIDLLLRARQLQLFSSQPSQIAPVAALDIANDGVLAFAIAGSVCLTHIDWLTPLPQSRPLF